jgi:hypothetical protein
MQTQGGGGEGVGSEQREDEKGPPNPRQVLKTLA